MEGGVRKGEMEGGGGVRRKEAMEGGGRENKEGGGDRRGRERE